VRTRPVSHRRRGGRARWKSATATCQTRHNQGEHCEHHSGHGAPHRSVGCAVLRMLACWVDQTQQRCGAVCQAVWAKLGSTRLLGERRRALLSDEALASLRQRCDALLDGVKKSRPMVAIDAASSPALASATACQRPSQPGDLPSWGRALPPSREASAFNKTAWHVASRQRFTRRNAMVETLTELSASIGA